jgi:hypothetical protein
MKNSQFLPPSPSASARREARPLNSDSARPWIRKVLHHLSSAEALRVPVERARVEIRTDEGRRDGVIFLTPGASPSDLFEEEGPFFPAQVGEAVLLISRAAVVILAVDVESAQLDRGSLADLGVEYELRQLVVKLRSGDIVRGNVLSLSPSMRTLDLLNQPAKSFALHVDGKVLHIAKAHIAEVEELR